MAGAEGALTVAVPRWKIIEYNNYQHNDCLDLSGFGQKLNIKRTKYISTKITVIVSANVSSGR
jgi:hypothetical protein